MIRYQEGEKEYFLKLTRGGEVRVKANSAFPDWLERFHETEFRESLDRYSDDTDSSVVRAATAAHPELVAEFNYKLDLFLCVRFDPYGGAAKPFRNGIRSS